MIQPRLRAFAGVSVLAATLGLAACGERAAAPAADTAVQTDPVDDTRTAPSEAARAQQSGEAITGPETAPRADATTDAAVELCDPGIGAAQLADARARQQQEFVRLGGDAATFDQEFTTAHGRVQAQYRSATPAQQQQMCAELQQMSQQAPTPTPPQG